jgi:hypothetical protein
VLVAIEAARNPIVRTLPGAVDQTVTEAARGKES